MNLMFWKKKAATEDPGDDAQDSPATGKSAGREPRDRETPEEAHGETAGNSPAHPRQRLAIVTAIVGLVLAGTGITAWKYFLPSPEQHTATDGAPTSTQAMALPEKNLIKLPPVEFLRTRKESSSGHPADIEALKEKNSALQSQIDALKISPPQADDPQSINLGAEIETLKKNNDELQSQIGVLEAELPKIEKDQAERHQAEIDALIKKNSELQAQIEALKKKPQQHPSTSPASRPTGKAQPTTPGSELAIGSNNPRSTAMTLKEAIEIMNAGSGEPAKKSAK